MDALPYILLLLLLGLNLKINTKTSNNFMFFVIFLFSALRYDVGYDYMSYRSIIIDGADFIVDRFEPAQKLLVYLSRISFTQVFFIVNSFISVYFIKWALQRVSKDVSLSVFTFFTFPLLFMHSMNIVRFWSAIAIVFYASILLNERKYILSTILFLIALTFHNGAIIGLLFIPLYLFRIPYWVNILILIFGFIGGEFVLSEILNNVIPSNIYSERLLTYANREGVDGMKKIPYIFLIIDLISLLYIKNLKPDNAIYKQFTIFNLGVSLMFLFNFQTTLATRFSTPFICYLMIIIPYLVKYRYDFKFYKGWNIRMFAYCIICSSLLLYNIMIYNSSLGRSQYIPYKTFFIYENN